MSKWEYVTVPLLVHATKQILDNWGDDGWELVAVIPGPNPEQLVAYMKRPKDERHVRAGAFYRAAAAGPNAASLRAAASRRRGSAGPAPPEASALLAWAPPARRPAREAMS